LVSKVLKVMLVHRENKVLRVPEASKVPKVMLVHRVIPERRVM
jgi:hypothetical protein